MKRQKLANWTKEKKKIQWYAAYRRLTLALRPHTDLEWRDGERYFKQTLTKKTG